MPEREERDHDLRGQVKALAKLINDQVKRNARLEKRVTELEQEVTQMREAPIIAALDRIVKAVQESKGDMTFEEEQEVGAAQIDLNKTAGEIPQNPVPANDPKKT